MINFPQNLAFILNLPKMNFPSDSGEYDKFDESGNSCCFCCCGVSGECSEFGDCCNSGEFANLVM